jgi:shikimate kinase
MVRFRLNKKLYIVYGLPACGKQSVAELLSVALDVSLYYHHLAFDAAIKKYKKHSDIFRKYYGELYFSELKKLSIQNSVVTTFNYHSEKKSTLNTIRNFASENNLEIIYLKLNTSTENIHKRVVLDSRKKNKKMLSVKEIEAYMENVIPENIKTNKFELHYEYDTNNISKEDVVMEIMKDLT